MGWAGRGWAGRSWAGGQDKPHQQSRHLRPQGKQEKVGLSLKSAPEPGSTLLHQPEGRIAPATAHTAACCRQGPGRMLARCQKPAQKTHKSSLLSLCQGARSFPPLPSTARLKGCSTHCGAGGHKDFSEWRGPHKRRELSHPFLLPLPFPPALSCRRQAWSRPPEGS